MTLFDRDWRVTVGELRVSKPMRAAFEIERTLRPQPNKATVRLWNLTRDHQAQLENATAAQVIVEAGFVDDRGPEQIFRGELFRARGRAASGPSAGTDVDASDAVTYVEARDGGRSYASSRIEQSFEPGVRIATVLRACADALGVGPGNLDQVANVAAAEAGGDIYPEGTVLSGQASRELTRILAGLGLRWSVQHGMLQILRRGQALQTQAIRLTSSSGLVGRPEIGTRGRVHVVALLTPDLWPGRVVMLQTERVEGRYTVQAVTYRGDSHADAWFAECELAPESGT